MAASGRCGSPSAVERRWFPALRRYAAAENFEATNNCLFISSGAGASAAVSFQKYTTYRFRPGSSVHRKSGPSWSRLGQPIWRHHGVDLGLEDVDRLLDPRQSEGDRAVQCRAAEGHELRAEAHRDQYVGAAPDAAVEHHGHPVADRRLDRRQRVERGRRLVELAAAVVRYEDAVARRSRRRGSRRPGSGCP